MWISETQKKKEKIFFVSEIIVFEFFAVISLY